MYLKELLTYHFRNNRQIKIKKGIAIILKCGRTEEKYFELKYAVKGSKENQKSNNSLF
jgi:hypothetical protein